MRAAFTVLAVLTLSHSLYAADPVSPLSAAPADSTLHEATLRLRIYNYTSIGGRHLSEAQRLVSDVYLKAGVRIIWEPVLNRPVPVDPSTAPRMPVADVSIMLFNNEMSRRMDADPNIVGSAAVSMRGPGSIAYVHGERVKRVAKTQEQVRDILSFVIAHELSHLLLPPGCHTEAGLMRGEWSAPELRRLSIADFALTEAQRGTMRERVRSYGAGPLHTLLSD